MKLLAQQRARLGCAATVCALLFAALPGGAALPNPAAQPSGNAAAVSAEVPVSAFIVHFIPTVHPGAGEPISAWSLSEMQLQLGQALTADAPTRAGDPVIRLATPVSGVTARELLNRLRMRGDVVWAELEPAPAPRVAAKAATAGRVTTGGAPTVRRLIVTFSEPALAHAARLNASLGTERDAALSIAGERPLHVMRATVGGAWLVEPMAKLDIATAEALAARLEANGVARYAAPDYPVAPALVPNDAYFAAGKQWNLSDKASTGYTGIDATHAWDITTGSADIVVAVVDTGIVPHPDLTRVLPGYDFISDPTSANDNGGRDADATDSGDWRDTTTCPAPSNTAQDSSWHGTLVSGIIAADGNNGIGIAGIDWKARILPVRALGRCDGTFSDILAGMNWAAGLPVPGVPNNPTPARVINLSLAGEGSCSAQIQSMINAVLDAGAFIAAAAGNDNASADGYVPANCLGVSTVAATDPHGSRASYSNFGKGIDIAAPGGDADRLGISAGIITTWNSGKTVAASPSYAVADGTSLSTPHVAAVAALMLAVNPALQPAQLKALMAQTASPFAALSDCQTQGICGAGVVNAFGAVKAAQGGSSSPGPAAVVEYYNMALDHYFMTASQIEINALDTGQLLGWQRTGWQFKAFTAPGVGLSPVCRFYIPPGHGDSHFYSAAVDECAQTLAAYPFFRYESPNVFYIALPDRMTGACPSGTIPVYRVWDKRFDTNHRYMTSTAVRAQMVALGWVAEGYGPDAVIMCAQQ